MDTRSAGGAVGSGATRSLVVAGVPAGATGVVLNVTVTNTGADSFLTVYPTGTVRPNASNLNWTTGKTIANLVEVPLGPGGSVTFYNNFGTTDVVADLEGYFAAPASSAGGQVGLVPSRITDTRAGSGQPNAGNTLGTGSTITVQVTGAGGVPATGVSAAILNVTATNTGLASFFTVWPTGQTRPLASNLNWVPGQTVPNRVFVPVGAGGMVSIFNLQGAADAVVDVSGYFTDASATGKLFTPQNPVRIADTRGTANTLGTAQTFTLQVGGNAGVPAAATAVILNVTATVTNADSFLTVYPSTASRPLASDLNWVAGQTVPNLVVATLGTTGAITFFNNFGSADVVVDLFGYFGASSGISLSATPGSIPANGTATSLITATVNSAGGTPVSGDSVLFSTSGGAACGGLAPNPVTTGVNGQASTTYTATATAGVCTITATEANGGTSSSTSVTQTQVKNTVTVVFYNIPGGAPETAVPVNGTATVGATVLKGFGPPTAVAGDVVTFSVGGANPAGACGTLSATTATTGGSGLATVIYTASGVIGFCTVTATEAATGGTGASTITQTSTTPGTTSVIVTPTPASVPADGATTSSVLIQVNGAGNTGDFVMVALSGTACGTLSASSGTTNGSGAITVIYTPSTVGGSCTVTASEANGGLSGTAGITQVPVRNNMTISATPSTLAANSASTSTITVTVTRGVGGAAVVGDLVGITTSGGPTCGTLGTRSGTPAGTTNASGQVVVLYTSSAAAGFCTITATDASSTPATYASAANATTTITQTTAGVATAIAVTANPTTIAADGVVTSLITATVTNAGGNVSGDLVNFARSGAACGVPASSTATTAANGQAQITYAQPVTPTPGVCTITATESSAGLSGTTTVTQTQVKSTVAVTGAGGSTMLINGTKVVTATVTTVGGGVPANGDVVTFTVGGANPAGACGTLSSPTATTTGGAASVTYTASGTIGFCTVTATEAATGGSGSLTITQTASPATTTSITVTPAPGTIAADGAATSVVTTQVGGPGNSSDLVMFTLGAGCGTLSASSGTTNATGAVSVTYTAGTVGGSCTITATEANGGRSGTGAVSQTPVANKFTATASPSAIQGNGTSTSTYTFTVTRGIGGAPVAGDSLTGVSFTGTCGTFSLPAGSTWPVTNASGQATLTYTSSNAVGFCSYIFREFSSNPAAYASAPDTTVVLTQTA